MNSGYDAQETILKLTEARNESGLPVGIDLESGEGFQPLVCLFTSPINLRKVSGYLG